MDNRIVSVDIVDGELIVTYQDGSTESLGPVAELDPEELSAAVLKNAGDIVDLKRAVSALQTSVTALDTAVGAAETSIDSLEAEVGAIKNDLSESIVYTSNLVNPDEIVHGYMSASLVADDGYRTTGLITIEKNTQYVKYSSNPGGLGSSALHLFIQREDNPDGYIDLNGTKLTDDNRWAVFDLSGYVGRKVRFSNTYTRTGDNTMYFGEGSTVLDVIPEYGFSIGSHGTIDYSQVKNAPVPINYDYRSALTGKVWYALGDSATHGDGAETLNTGIYSGQLGVYPFYIGNRTGVVVHNLAVNSAVMATIPEQPSRYQFSVDGHYDSIGSDADIITIWLGANDMWQNVPIGTIDSNDATTFYGAYNKVLNWIINNRPYAKIGLVASFWCTAEYAEAVIAIGKKYGIPVLNLYNDPNVPVTVGSQRPDVSSAVKTLRNDQYIVSSSNAHPSSKYHEIESYFIEEWLKTL